VEFAYLLEGQELKLMNANIVFLLNLVSTWFLIGLIWMVQVVHYKMFDRVGADQFAKYEQDHNLLITPVVGIHFPLELRANRRHSSINTDHLTCHPASVVA
jgi:hypothetical protein